MAPSWWVDEANTRGTYGLVSSCIFTLGLCVWTAIHLNIPEPGAGARQFMRKILWLGMGLMAPEVVTFIAWNQYSSAKRIVSELSSSEWEKTAVSTWRSLQKYVGLSGPAYESVRLDDVDVDASLPPFGADWDLIHGFYVVMGGYAIDLNGKSSNRFLPPQVKRLTLTPDGLLFLAKRAPELMPRISEEDIEDKSKADGLAKLLVAFQAGWFCLQCISRGAKHLPISLLEITTGAHALYTLFTYLLWAKKPMNISVPTTLPPVTDNPKLRQLCAYMYMCSSVSGKMTSRDASNLKPVASYMGRTAECQWISVEREGYQPLPPTMTDRSSKTSLKRENVTLGYGAGTLPGTGLRFMTTTKIQFDNDRRLVTLAKRKPGLPIASIELQPEDVVRWRLAWDLISSDSTLEFTATEYLVLRSSNVPTYDSWEYATKRMIFGFTVAEVLYGLIHASGWNATFSSPWMQHFWQVASCIISGGGLLLGGAFAWAAGESSWYSETFSAIVVVGTFEFFIRMFLLVEAVLNVGSLPRGVYDLPDSSIFVPHWA